MFFFSFLLSIDGGLGLSILPLAALVAGTLFTIGIAVLLIVVLAIRKRRDPVSRNICDDKDKHLGKLFSAFVRVLVYQCVFFRSAYANVICFYFSYFC